jgi:hypothetical protein
MDIDKINQRVDQALAANRRAENFIIGMAFAIFVLGVIITIVAYWHTNPYVGSAAVVVQMLLYWPIKEVLKVRRDNLILQSFPILVTTLPPDRLVDELAKTLEFIRRS